MDQQTKPPLTLPANASVFTRVRTGLHALWALRNDAGNPYYAPLLHLCFDEQTYAKLAKQLRETETGRRLLDDKPTIPAPELDFEALEAMPAGTLGHEFAAYYRKMGIEPFSFDFALGTDADYLNKRYRETHDIHHILTGYGIDPLGEIELQAFYVGNLGLRHALIIALVSYPWRLKQDGVRSLGEHHRRLRDAYYRGRDAAPILELDVEALWRKPVEEVAAMLAA